MLIGALSLLLVSFGLISYMAFWGDASQSKISIEFLKTIGVAVAGYGVVHAASKGIQVLLKR